MRRSCSAASCPPRPANGRPPCRHWRKSRARETVTVAARPAAAQPLITVCMAVYNSERTVVGAVESILEQTFEDFELVCVDDGSSDSSLEILRELAQTDGRVKVLQAPKPMASASPA